MALKVRFGGSRHTGLAAPPHRNIHCGGESTLDDAMMDHITYDSYKIDIESIDPEKDLSNARSIWIKSSRSKITI